MLGPDADGGAEVVAAGGDGNERRNDEASASGERLGCWAGSQDGGVGAEEGGRRTAGDRTKERGRHFLWDG